MQNGTVPCLCCFGFLGLCLCQKKDSDVWSCLITIYQTCNGCHDDFTWLFLQLFTIFQFCSVFHLRLGHSFPNMFHPLQPADDHACCFAAGRCHTPSPGHPNSRHLLRELRLVPLSQQISWPVTADTWRRIIRIGVMNVYHGAQAHILEYTKCSTYIHSLLTS